MRKGIVDAGDELGIAASRAYFKFLFPPVPFMSEFYDTMALSKALPKTREIYTPRQVYLHILRHQDSPVEAKGEAAGHGIFSNSQPPLLRAKTHQIRGDLMNCSQEE